MVWKLCAENIQLYDFDSRKRLRLRNTKKIEKQLTGNSFILFMLDRISLRLNSNTNNTNNNTDSQCSRC